MTMVAVDIQIASEDDDHPPPVYFEKWVKAAIASRQDDVELTVRIVDEEESRHLNNSYRGINKPTNVLSFPAELPDHIDIPLLGDLVICAPIVAKEAVEQNKPALSHWAHMVIHGTLHLLGYDHIDDSDAEKMEAFEIEILASLEIPNPYSINNESASHQTLRLQED
jgi:probable rRNA maturation factor